MSQITEYYAGRSQAKIRDAFLQRFRFACLAHLDHVIRTPLDKPILQQMQSQENYLLSVERMEIQIDIYASDSASVERLNYLQL